MDLWRLNAFLEPDTEIRDIESCIWTERHKSFGDFKLVFLHERLTAENLGGWPPLLSSSIRTTGGHRIMMVESAFTKVDKGLGGFRTELTGRSFEALFLKKFFVNSDASSTVSRTNYPAETAEYFVERYVANAATAPTDAAITQLNVLTSGITTGGSSYREYPRGNMYDLVKAILDPVSDLGWAITLGGYDTINFQVYSSVDRTDSMIYSQDADNFIPDSRYDSVAEYYNHVRVLNSTTYVDVYSKDASWGETGIARRSAYLHYPDVTDTNALEKLGDAFLALPENRHSQMVDGLLVPGTSYYNLGDKVVLKDIFGDKTDVQITELITTMDKTGNEMTIPTFELYT